MTNKSFFSIDEYLNSWESEIDKLRNMPKEQAKEISLQALIRTGVLNPDGSSKKQICNR